MTNIAITYETPDILLREEEIAHLVEVVLGEEGFECDFELGVTFVDDDAIEELNKEYRGIAAPTDVLSFPLDIESREAIPACTDEPVLLGDIVISTPRCIEQASLYQNSQHAEVIVLFIHGLLHLLGYDHIDDADALIMRQREKVMLNKVQLGDALTYEEHLE